MQLVFIDNGRPVTDSLTVSQVFEKPHDKVLRDIRELGCSKDFSLSNFGESTYTNERGREYPKVVMTEQGFALLVMGYTGSRAMEFKEKYIAEFDRMRAELAKPRILSRLELIEMARESELGRLDAERKRIEAEQKAAEYHVRLQEQAPKVVFADAIAVSQNSILVRELAIILKQNGVDVGAGRLFAYLREKGYLVKRHGSDWNTPTQKSMELRLFEIKETPVVHSSGHVTVSKTPKVTGKGQVYFVNLFKRGQSLESVT